MKISSPFYTPKQILETNRLMRDVREGTALSRYVRYKRHQAYLSHSQFGYTPEQPKKNLHQMLGNFVQNIKCKFLSK